MDRKSISRPGSQGEGSTLLKYLSARFSYLGVEEWRSQIDEGRISLNGAATSAERILSRDDLVAFDSSGFEEPEVDAGIEIVHEDEDFLIVAKSGSLPCHPGGRFFKHSLWFILRESRGPLHIVTRLDRETSGLVLLCKNPAATRYAQSLLATGSLDKDYLALVHGSFPEKLQAKGFLMRDEGSLVRKKRRYVDSDSDSNIAMPEAEACDTLFELVSEMMAGAGPVSLVRARPRTGRTHQIRASLYSLGFPVVGDKLYGLDEVFFIRFIEGGLSAEDLSRLALPSQALHCSGLNFRSPSGLVLRASSKPPWGGVFAELLAQLPCLT